LNKNKPYSSKRTYMKLVSRVKSNGGLLDMMWVDGLYKSFHRLSTRLLIRPCYQHQNATVRRRHDVETRSSCNLSFNHILSSLTTWNECQPNLYTLRAAGNDVSFPNPCHPTEESLCSTVPATKDLLKITFGGAETFTC
jgi:hypothetical protein